MSSIPQLELFIQEIGPLPQAVMLALLEKGLRPGHDFIVTGIDTQAPPPRFMELSPTGNPPMLLIDGQVIFETVVILNCVEDIIPGAQLLPKNPIDAAEHRSWLSFGVDLLMQSFSALMAPTLDTYNEAHSKTRSRLERLEIKLESGPYFSGENISLVDLLYAPFFQRTRIFQNRYSMDLLSGLEKTQAWSNHLLELPTLPKSLPSHFEASLTGWLDNCGSYVTSRAHTLQK